MVAVQDNPRLFPRLTIGRCVSGRAVLRLPCPLAGQRCERDGGARLGALPYASGIDRRTVLGVYIGGSRPRNVVSHDDQDPTDIIPIVKTPVSNSRELWRVRKLSESWPPRRYQGGSVPCHSASTFSWRCPCCSRSCRRLSPAPSSSNNNLSLLVGLLSRRRVPVATARQRHVRAMALASQ